jgi:O-antigen/teichoic acid export membrane protein
MTSLESKTPARLGSQAALVFAGNVFTLALGLPLQIYVAKVLGAESLGVFSLIEGSVNLVAGLLAFGLAPTVVKFIPAHLERQEYGELRRLVLKSIVILAVAGLAAYGFVLLSLPLAAVVWPQLGEHRMVVAVMGLLIPAGLLLFLLQQGLRGFQEVRYMVIGSSFLQLTAKAILSVVLLALGLQVLGYAWAVVISVLIAGAWMGLGLWRKLRLLPVNPSPQKIVATQRAWRDYARVMYGGSLVSVAAQHTDRFLLGAMAGAGPVGVLMIVRQLHQMPVFFLQMFLSVAAPMFSLAHAKSDSAEMQHLYHLSTDWIVRLSASLFVFLFFFGEPLLGLFGPQFASEGKHALWILLIGQTVNLAFGPVGAVMNMWGHEKLMFKFAVWQHVISIVAMAALIPGYGITGAAIGLTVGLIFLNVIALAAAQAALGLRWADRRFVSWLLPLAATVASALLLKGFGPDARSGGSLILIVIILYAVFFVSSLVQGLHEDDRDLLRHLHGRLFTRTP